MLEYHGVDELWNMILCVSDDNLANDATRFLLDMYYTKQPNRTRRTTPQLLHEYFLKEVYTRLSYLLSTAVPPSITLTEEMEHFYKSLKTYGEQLTTTTTISHSSITNEINHTLWLQKIERLLMITEEYIHIVEHEHSQTAHITSFHGLEYQIKILLGEIGKTNSSYDIVTVHSNDTLEMLRVRLGQYFKVPSYDIHISIQNTRPLPQSYDHLGMNNTAIPLSCSSNNQPNNSNNSVLGSWLNSKYLYQVHITPGTTVYIKILGSSNNQPIKSGNYEPVRMNLNDPSLIIPTRHMNNSNLSTNEDLTRLTPSNMMAENSKVYDVLYKLSYLNNKNIHKRIRNLLYLMPSDIRINDYLDLISIRAVDSCTTERRQSTETSTNTNPVNSRKAIECIFDVNNYSPIQLLYNLEILSSRIVPLSTNNGIQQSSKLFRQDFIEQSGVEFLFQLLNSLNDFITDEYQYSLCQEMTILILQLIQLLVCGNNQQDDNHSTSMQISPASSSLSLQISQTVNDSINDSIDSDYRATVENLQFEEFVEEIKQLIFLCWAAAAGNLKLHGQNSNIKEQVKLDRHALLQQVNANIFCRNSSKNSLSNESSTNYNVEKTVQFGICVKKDAILPLDGEIAEKIIEIVIFCFEKRPEFIGKYEE
jgi:hypothetical protein